MKIPAETVYQFKKAGSGVHVSFITMPVAPYERYIIASSTKGCIEVIKQGE